MKTSKYPHPLRPHVTVASLPARAVTALRPLTLPMLRIGLGILFVWFGGLKLAGASPVGKILAGTLPWADPALALAVLGAAEVVLGVALSAGFALRLAAAAVVLHLSGTFLAFVMVPALMYNQGNPLLLTESGEFVMKNLVLLGAALVVFTQAAADKPSKAAAAEPSSPTSRARGTGTLDINHSTSSTAIQTGNRARTVARG